ncbi:putative DNA-binding transcriptional regulator [Methylobacterium sp. 88A]|uniref:putative DNA-binding transcriptional regulator n=1 Tax=Methylobacterium sp. 88A TaxID=1131813 RepID=UPI00035E4E02|nr:putative DNA-binding transcriptional regulator [Methylobacterium sp. 88A]
MELPLETRRLVEQLMRTTSMTSREIAERTGVRAQTVSTWNRQHGWREGVSDAQRRLDPGAWAPARRRAVETLYGMMEVEPATLALALGGTVAGAPALFRACGFERRPRARPAPRPPKASAPLPAARVMDNLGEALRAHIGRQIARFDAALSGETPPALDSAKVLRDLGGLKRLLDDLSSEDRERSDAQRNLADGPFAEGTRATSHPPADDGDLPALRAAIAARYAACLGERPDAGLPGEPAAAPDPGAGLGLAP